MNTQQLLTLSNYYLMCANAIGLQISDLAWRNKPVPAQMKANYSALWDKKNALKERAYSIGMVK